MLNLVKSLTVLISLLAAGHAMAQSQIAFGGLKHDSSLPIEVSADQLQVNQADGTAIFKGNVKVGQGDMRLSASQVRVEYATGADSTGEISRLFASGNVILVNGAEAAEANQATYTIDSGRVVMTGNVLLTQGNNALSSDTLTVDLNTGTGIMDGNVKSIIQTGGN
ncbi:LptA/OstA family protein [Aliiroseovarius crassostreae]|uniref:LptA/OstA family protein n=1 Tax=Aliiroseovarius crassostreae TaxID=154981 RepID=UPI0035CD0AB6